MGQEVARRFGRTEGIEVAFAVDRDCVGQSLRSVAGGRAPELPISNGLGAALDAHPAHVLVDFTHPGCAADHALSSLRRGVAPVIGTSGVSASDVQEIREACEEFQTPAMIVPNFAIGAVLMMKFAELAARWMPDVEIIELHHDQKLDAPSGTAKRTAEMIAMARQHHPAVPASPVISVEGVLGGSHHNVPVHSVRLRGLVAHQICLFGGEGETLTVRHDSHDRASFMTGVELCVRQVWNQKGCVVGLDNLLFPGLGR
jgi:4-hydroxy-tetrahydrodipicolinate reductase